MDNGHNASITAAATRINNNDTEAATAAPAAMEIANYSVDIEDYYASCQSSWQSKRFFMLLGFSRSLLWLRRTMRLNKWMLWLIVALKSTSFTSSCGLTRFDYNITLIWKYDFCDWWLNGLSWCQWTYASPSWGIQVGDLFLCHQWLDLLHVLNQLFKHQACLQHISRHDEVKTIIPRLVNGPSRAGFRPIDGPPTGFWAGFCLILAHPWVS